MRADELPAIDWGRLTPDSTHDYYDDDGSLLFTVGRKRITSTGRDQVATMYFSGAEWVRMSPKNLPKHLIISRPLYNLVGGSGSLGILPSRGTDAKIVLVENEKIADSVNYFMRQWEMESDYIASTWHGGSDAISFFRQSDLEGREVLLWTSNNERAASIKSQVFIKLAGCVDKFRVVPLLPDVNFKFSPADIVDDGNVTMIKDALERAVEIDAPTIDIQLDEVGLCDLETPPPGFFIENMKQKYGKTLGGKLVMQSDYFTCLAIAKEDPAFVNSVKYDEAIGQAIWRFRRYPSIDDLKNAFIRRFSLYGLSPGLSVRADVFDSLIADGAGRINSVTAYLDSLVEKYPDLNLSSPTNELFEYIQIPAESDLAAPPDKMRYIEGMNWFFQNACYHILLAATDDAIPNDVVPVFVGGQGVGKTRLTRYIATAPRYYGEITSNVALGSPDFSRKIQGRLIVELGEMNVYKKTDVETVKAVISQAYDEFTPKFKEGVRKFPRVASFIGTSNNTMFLKDKTGNRRFFPMMITKVNEELFKRPDIIEQCWAAHWYMAKSMNEINGTKWMPPPTGMAEYFNMVQDASVDHGPIEDTVVSAMTFLERQKISIPGGLVKFTLQEIINQAFVDKSRIPWDIKQSIGAILKKFGYDKRNVRIGGVQINGFALPKDDAMMLKRINEYDKPSF